MRTLLRLWLLVGIGTCVALGTPGNVGALKGTTQSQLIQGTVYVTKNEEAPNGAILKLLDLELGFFQTIVTPINRPGFILCGPDWRLYVTESSPTTYSRILRFNQDGSGRTVVLSDSANLRLTVNGLCIQW